MPGLSRQADDQPLGDRGPLRGRRPCPSSDLRTRAPLSLEPHLALPRAAARQHRRDGNGTETQGNRPRRRLDERSGVGRMTTDIIIYHNPECGTSRNTLAMIRNACIEPHVVEYLKTPPSRALLEELGRASGRERGCQDV